MQLQATLPNACEPAHLCSYCARLAHQVAAWARQAGPRLQAHRAGGCRCGWGRRRWRIKTLRLGSSCWDAAGAAYGSTAAAATYGPAAAAATWATHQRSDQLGAVGSPPSSLHQLASGIALAVWGVRIDASCDQGCRRRRRPFSTVVQAGGPVERRAPLVIYAADLSAAQYQCCHCFFCHPREAVLTNHVLRWGGGQGGESMSCHGSSCQQLATRSITRRLRAQGFSRCHRWSGRWQRQRPQTSAPMHGCTTQAKPCSPMVLRHPPSGHSDQLRLLPKLLRLLPLPPGWFARPPSAAGVGWVGTEVKVRAAGYPCRLPWHASPSARSRAAWPTLPHGRRSASTRQQARRT